MIRAVIFDCFGVLMVDASHHFYEHQVPRYAQLRPELQSLNKAHDYGLISAEDHHQQVAELTGLDLDFIKKNIQGVHRRNDGLIELIGRLRPEYKVGMLSNIGPQSMDQFFNSAERTQFFDAVVLSGEEGITKPHPFIFTLMAERLGVPAGDCVMIDDIAENCQGADAAGMQAIHYKSVSQTIAELRKLGIVSA